MKHTNTFIKYMILYPASVVYGLIVGFRNKLYDLDILKTKEVDVRTIGLGNITVGGTGKTPHSEYVISKLLGSYNVAYLSRGYKRKKAGFIIADEHTTPKEIGDEAYQIYSKFPNVTVAVNNKRVAGIERIINRKPDTDVVVLDDVYQHRRLKVGLNILLIDYNRLTYYDRMLPYGELRENYKNTDRADVIIITKCPDDILPVDCLAVRKQIDPFPYQKIYFTRYDYLKPKHVYTDRTVDLDNIRNVLIIAGIAQPKSLIDYVEKHVESVKSLSFDDHHNFTHQDILKIYKYFSAMPEGSIILITEKDKTKIQMLDVPDKLKEAMYCIDISVTFLNDGEDSFREQIFKYMRCKVI